MTRTTGIREAKNADAIEPSPSWWKCDTHGPAKANAWGCPECVREMRDEIERLRNLVRRALPMADALDATKTAVVWTVDLQVGATALARDIRAALRA